jgi:Protein of unknown function (DUF3105)
MSSRQEEKERRRQEREAAERAAQQSAARRKRLGIVGGAVLLVAVLVIGVLALAGGDDGGGGGGNGNGVEAGEPPAQKITNLNEAVEAAGCKLDKPRNEGSEHTADPVKYTANPPTSGDHDPVPAEDGKYDPGNSPDVEASVHSLEHGRINVQYKKGSPTERIAQLSGMVDESLKGEGGYKTLFFENQTNMTAAVAATAWDNSLTCPQWNDQVFDAIRAFRRDFVDKGPEFLP